MVALPRCIFQRSCNVARFEEGKVIKNLLMAGTGGQKVQHIPNADTQAAQARTAAALAGIDSYAVDFAHHMSP